MNESDREDKRRSREPSQKDDEEKDQGREQSRGRPPVDTRERNDDSQEKDAEQVRFVSDYLLGLFLATLFWQF